MDASMSNRNPANYQPLDRIDFGAQNAKKALELLRENGLSAWYTDLGVQPDGTVEFMVHIPGKKTP
jgi:hypothetical protein